MEFRLARIEDLKQLKIIYKEIIKNMNKNNIQIWDDIYPCEFFEDDINNKRLYVIADDEEKTAKVVVPDYQLSLAIGKEGQNARLAARLTGFKIDIKSETQAREAGDFIDYENDYEDEYYEDGEEYYDENGEYIEPDTEEELDNYQETDEDEVNDYDE